MSNEILIHIQGLSKSFRNIPVLRQLDLDIDRGETLVVMGQSGEGKSVLLRHMIGLTKPDEGHIYIDGKDMVPLGENELNGFRKRFGVLFQGAALFDSLTVGENVAFGLCMHQDLEKDKIDQKVRELLSLIGLEGIEEMKPAELSGGMKKRVGLARAIAMDPEIIFYDEPTTGIDPIMGDVINDLILKLKKHLHATSIVVTHDMASAFKIADRIAMLYDGKIVEIGTPAQFRSSKNTIIQQFIAGTAQSLMKEGTSQV